MNARRIIALDRDARLVHRLKDEFMELGYQLHVDEFSSLEACYRAIFPELATLQAARTKAPTKAPDAPPTLRLALDQQLQLLSKESPKVEVPQSLWGHPVPAQDNRKVWDLALAPTDRENLAKLVEQCLQLKKAQHLLAEARESTGKTTWHEFRIAPFEANSVIVELFVSNAPPAEPPGQSSPKPAAAKGPEGHNSIDLIILDTELVKDPLAWIAKIRALLAEKKLLMGPVGATKFLLTGFESHNIDPRKLRSEWIDDFVYKPFDWPILSQKIGLALSDKQEPPKGLLFNMKVERPIDIAKEARVEALSDYGWCISNPLPLKPGTIATFFAPQLSIGRPEEPLVAQVMASHKHPTKSGQFQIEYGFVGLKGTQLLAIRSQLRKSKGDSRPKPHSPKPKVDPLMALMKKEAKPGNGLILDFDRETLEALRETLKSLGNGGYDLKWYSSLAPLLRLMQPPGKATAASPPAQPASEPNKTAPTVQKASEDELDLRPSVGAADGSGNTVGWAWTENPILFIDRGSGNLLEVEGQLADDDFFLGRALKLMLGEKFAVDSVIRAEDRSFYLEFVSRVQQGHKDDSCFRWVSEQGVEYWIRVDGRPTEVGASPAVSLSFHAASEQDIADYLSRTGQELGDGGSLAPIDFLMVEASLLPEDPTNFFSEVRQSLARIGANKHAEHLPILVIGNDRNLDQVEKWIQAGASEVLRKPADRALVLAKLSRQLAPLLPKGGFEVPEMAPSDIEVFVGKKVQLMTVSEFGVTILSNTKLRPGIFLRFFAPMLIDNKGLGAMGRCYKVTVSPNDKSQYIAEFSFFAVTDVFQKHIRQFIRSDYAEAKSEALNE